MATIKIIGMDELQKKLSKLEKGVEVELKEKMLDEGAKTAIEVWKEIIISRHHIDTKDMLDSIGVSAATKKGDSRDIYPQGIDRKGVRNALKAFILHYGKRGKEGDLFVDEIDEILNIKARETMKKVMDDYFKKNGI